MTENLDAALRHALQDWKAGNWAADSQPIVDAIRAIVREEIEAAIAKRLAEYFAGGRSEF